MLMSGGSKSLLAEMGLIPPRYFSTKAMERTVGEDRPEPMGKRNRGHARHVC